MPPYKPIKVVSDPPSVSRITLTEMKCKTGNINYKSWNFKHSSKTLVHKEKH